MSDKNETIKIFRCNICNKKYASHSSLCNHNKIFHNNKIGTHDVQVGTINEKISTLKVPKLLSNLELFYQNIPIPTVFNNNTLPLKYSIKCNFCNRLFNDRSNKYKHEKICKLKNQFVHENIDIKNILKENLEIKNMLKELLEKNCGLNPCMDLRSFKIHPKTLQKINKQLVNNNSNNTCTINNGSVINNTYVKFGNEQLSTLLKHKDMLNIINKQCLCIEESIKSVHFNKNLPEYNNLFITNMKDTIAYIFDGFKFILTTKDEVTNNLYNSHLENIEQFLEETEIPENKYSKITKFLDALNDNEKCFIDGANNNKKYSNYKAYKLIAIKNLIYNKSDAKILKKLNNIKLIEKNKNIK